MLRLLITTALLLTAATTSADEFHSYYPKELANYMHAKKDTSGEMLREYLFKVLNSTHQKQQGTHDTLGCNSGKGECYSQRSLGYKGARKVLFGKIHLQKDKQGYFIKDVYCRKEIRRRHTRVGPNIIPNHTILNCEHTWPQSRFSGQFNRGMQKSDLHHLYPTDSQANSVRGNYEFAEVNGGVVGDDCTASHTEGHGGRFEPPTEHKGNVARALFYFSLRYNMKISAAQENFLREWHRQDPVDAEERERNETIYIVQNNRNPFIDMPELVDQIANF